MLANPTYFKHYAYSKYILQARNKNLTFPRFSTRMIVSNIIIQSNYTNLIQMFLVDFSIRCKNLFRKTNSYIHENFQLIQLFNI